MAARADEAERSRALLDSAPDAIVIFDTDAKIVLVNTATERLFGYDRRELLQRPFQLLVPEYPGEGPRLPDRATAPAGPPLTPAGSGLELTGRRKDGTEFPTEVRLAPLETEEGSLVSSSIRDITVRNRAELQLRESEERFRMLVGAVKDYAIVMLDREGRVTSWNSGAERIKGYTAAEIVGQHFSRFFLPEDIRDGKPLKELQVAVAEGRHEDEGWRVRKDGSRFLGSVVITPVRDSGGTVVGFAKITRDVTERHMAQAALELANHELEAFSYSVAHDLRAPLRGMNGFAQVLLTKYRDQLDAEGQDWLEEILLNARKMGELIDGLLSLARVSKSDLRLERVDLSALARQVAVELAAQEPARAVDVSILEGLFAVVDPRLGRAIFENLLGNAWKFTRQVAKPRIEVGSTSHPRGRAFFVRDNGAGFDMAFASKLFSPFQRLHTVGEFPGTGIGLATVKRIVDRHGGRIWAEGLIDRGATFYFTIPESAERRLT